MSSQYRTTMNMKVSSQFASKDIHEAAAEASQFLGYKLMKEEQLQVVESLVSGNDVFGVLPMGLCYACLPLIYETASEAMSLQYTIIIIVSIMFRNTGGYVFS